MYSKTCFTRSVTVTAPHMGLFACSTSFAQTCKMRFNVLNAEVRSLLLDPLNLSMYRKVRDALSPSLSKHFCAAVSMLLQTTAPW